MDRVGSRTSALPLLRLAGILVLAVSLGVCTGGEPAPTEPGLSPEAFLVFPSFTFASSTAAQADALSRAFDLVDRFRVRVTRQDGTTVLDSLIVVTPAQDEYDFRLPVTLRRVGEVFTITLTALQGEIQLFSAGPFTAQATRIGAPAAAPAQILLTYSGPGSQATSVELDENAFVLIPGGSRTLVVTVLDDAGQEIAGVPIGWTSGSSSVASVSDDGVVSGAGQGATQITATLPTGLDVSAWVYVVGGTLAFVRDGHVFTANAEGGDLVDRTPAASDARGPAWRYDGSNIFYADGGSVHEANGGSLVLEGASWPAVSPDDTKLAAQKGGVVFANLDGSNESAGPGGGEPAWDTDGAHLYVSGGSVERVLADGTERTPVVPDAGAGAPAVAGDGRVAVLSGGAVQVYPAGGGTPAVPVESGASGRPAWSSDGSLLVVAVGGELNVVDPAGSAPPVPLGIGSGNDPAFMPSGAPLAPPGLALAGLSPEEPVPEDAVAIFGSGFDWIIPANTRVLFPTGTGPQEGQVTLINDERVVAIVPNGVVEGELQVETRTSSATLPFTPAPGTVRVTATKEGGAPLAGVAVRLLLDGTEVATGETDESGTLEIGGLEPGTYTVEITAPAGHTLLGDAVRSALVERGLNANVELSLTAQVHAVTITPEPPVTVAVGGAVAVTAAAVDLAGDAIPGSRVLAWGQQTSHLSVSGTGLTGEVRGVLPSTNAGDALFRIQFDDGFFDFTATVTTTISGTITDQAGIVIDGASVQLTGAASATTTTNNDGRYTFLGLLAGTYTVTPVTTGVLNPEPASTTLVLGQALPIGTADFQLLESVADSVDLTPDTHTFASVGDALAMTAQVFDSVPALINRTVTWTSSDPAVATVDASGNVTAVGNGTTTIRAQVDAAFDESTITVDQVVDSVDVQPAEIVLADVGDIDVFMATAYDANGNAIPGKTVVWTSGDPSVATVATDGTVTGVAQGVTTITATVDGVSAVATVRVKPVFAGTLTIASQEDVTAFAAAGYIEVTGSLIIDDNTGGGVAPGADQPDFAAAVLTPITSLGGMETLTKVGGSLIIRETGSLDQLEGLQNVTQVGDLYVNQNLALTSLNPTSFGNLTTVDGDVHIRDNPALTSIGGLSALSSVGALCVGCDFAVGNNDALTSIDGLSSLTSINGGLAISHNDALQNVAGLSALTSINGALHISDNASLTSLSGLSGLAGAVSNLFLDRNTSLTTLAGLEGITSVDLPDPDDWSVMYPSSGNLRIEQNDNLLNVDGLSGITTVRGEMWIGHNPVLQNLNGMSSLTTVGSATDDSEVGGELIIMNNPSLNSMNHLPALTFIGGPFRLDDRAGQVLGFPALESVGTLTDVNWDGARGFLQVRGRDTDPYDVMYDLDPRVTSGPVLTTLSLPSLTTVGAFIRIHNNPVLTTVDLRALVTAPMYGESFVSIKLNPALTSIDLSSLQTIGYEFEFEKNDALASISLPALTTVNGALRFRDHPSLSSINLGSLTTLDHADIKQDAWLQIRNAPSLTSIMGLGGLATVDGHIEIMSTGLTSLPSMGSLPATAALHIRDNWNLTSLGGLSGVTTLRDLDVSFNASLTNLTGLASLTQVTNDFTLIGNRSLATLAGVESLALVGGTLEIAENPVLTTLGGSGLSGLSTVGGQLETDENRTPRYPSMRLTIRDNPMLTDVALPALTQIEDAVSLSRGDLYIQRNDALTNLNGLSGLGSALRIVRVQNNASLTDVSGLNLIGDLDKPTAVTSSFWITGNRALTNAAAFALRDAIQSNTGGTVFGQSISANEPTGGTPVDFVDVDAGGYFTCAVSDAGAGYCWGRGNSGQLGNGSFTNYALPQPVSGGLTFTQIATGWAHACGTTDTDALYCWGENPYGEVGDGSTTNRSVPVLVSGGMSWQEVSAGFRHTCAVTTSGAAYCWGLGVSGQIGDAATGNRTTPTAVAGGMTFTSISAGWYHSCGVASGGVGYCWGNGGNGELGTGGEASSSTPVLVSGGHTWARISAGTAHSLGFTTGGTGYGWGWNSYGNLGTGTNHPDDADTGFLVLTVMAGGHAVMQLSAGDDHGCMVDTGGKAWCFGLNDDGQIGDATDIDRLAPSPVVGGMTFSRVEAGRQHSCGVAGNAVYCWGRNLNGELGDGSSFDALQPRKVVF